MDLPGLVSEYLESLRIKNSSQYTIKNYSHYLGEFITFNKTNQPISLELLVRFKQHLSKKGLSNETKNYYLIALRSFMDFLNSSKGIDELNKDLIKLNPHKRSIREKIDTEALERLTDSINDDLEGLRDKALIVLLHYLKVSEVYKLNRSDELSKYKLPGNVHLVIERYKSSRNDPYEPLFIRFKNQSGDSRLSIRSMERIVDKYSKRVNSPVKATPQILRNSL